ncbi:MAG: 3-oxoacyl-[acyl-carrier-protein] reductase [Nitrospinaceae bacterium]|jgi:3-oxoacyl-[acyl-carrier protein] reductase|nr:3-oxoacyl-[acyl-carrier-protein] reductase [Nitrospinaceae bacterium]MDP6711879.1 3-oxoacyl-[acyl-carrier-protein] reductase [Nitrospinaceae bacterium]MDP7056814.1 3-oxoacyl-[acyl-carrier-protein] reductase [Nitrospinaceae bacterium]HAK38157.1 3-oxoacyl-ACP reductase [Nitrospina sp.]|tara:strand:+ start:162 stop:902 length:741 start_codon:yes stop_codon:yes gene_type:complete
MELKDKVVLITGGGQGIGQTIGENLAGMGAHVVLADINQENAEKSAEAIRSSGGSASSVLLNVADAENVKQAFDSLANEFKPLDILVNNAGITKDGLLIRMKEGDWDSVLTVNLKGSFLCGQQAAKQMMKQRQGAIVNIASIVGVMGNAGQANYSASKAGLIGLTKTMARELASRNVTVNAIAPGFIDTEMTRVLDEKFRDKLIEQIPLARLGLPQDIAHSVAFLVSDRAGYITGQVLNVNGGMLM